MLGTGPFTISPVNLPARLVGGSSIDQPYFAPVSIAATAVVDGFSGDPEATSVAASHPAPSTGARSIPRAPSAVPAPAEEAIHETGTDRRSPNRARSYIPPTANRAQNNVERFTPRALRQRNSRRECRTAHAQM